jgi:hypothetical protein
VASQAEQAVFVLHVEGTEAGRGIILVCIADAYGRYERFRSAGWHPRKAVERKVLVPPSDLDGTSLVLWEERGVWCQASGQRVTYRDLLKFVAMLDRNVEPSFP